MKKNVGSIALALASAALILPSGPMPAVHAQGGGADFTRFVAVGDSLSAGFQDGGLFDGRTRVTDGQPDPINLGQTHGFVNLLGESMGTTVVLPLLSYPGATTTGILVRNEDQCAFGATAFHIVPPAPFARLNPTVPATDVAVPGQDMGDALTVKWDINPQDLSTVNTLEDLILGLPYAFAGATPKSQIETAVGLQPTFVSLWLGGNDALGAATGGDATLVTDKAAFNTNAQAVYDAVKGTGAKAVVANVPDVTVVAHMFSQADIVALTGGLIDANGVKLLTGVGPKDYVPLAAMTHVAGLLQGQTTVPLAANEILKASEVKKIRKAIKSYNKKIAALANANGWALVDVNGILNQYNTTGVNVGTTHLTTDYLGGIFSLDGIHPTNTGHALIATAFIQAINAKYGTTLAPPDVAAIAAADPEVCMSSVKEGITLDDIKAYSDAAHNTKDIFSGAFSR